MNKQLLSVLGLLLLMGFAATQVSAQDNQLLKEKYGPNYREVLRKSEGDPILLKKAADEYYEASKLDAFNKSLFKQKTSQVATDYVGGTEVEPNNWFSEATNIDNILAMEGLLNNGEYKGRLVGGEFSSATDVDIYEFTVDTTMMYYFGGLYGTSEDGSSIGVHMRLFHESDLDTTLVEDFKGIPGNEQIRGDLLGDDTDGRGGAGLFRLTGWSSFIDPSTRTKLTGKYYLWIFNDGGETGTYNFTAYQISRPEWQGEAESNYPYANLLNNAGNANAYLPTDGVVRSYMLYAPDTVKYQHPETVLPTQSNNVYDNLLSQGDEDVDLFFIDYKAGHTLVVETLPYFGYYRENDGSPRAGSTRLSDPRIRVYDGGFTSIIAEDDDGGREQMDGPNNIHSRIVLSSSDLAAAGVTTSGPLVYWAGAWASLTRDPGFQFPNSSDPGRMMYKTYAYQYSENPVEFEPNNTVETATVIAARTDTVVNGTFANASDVDMYRVYLNETRMYTIFTKGATSEVSVKMYLQSASGVTNDVTLSNDLIVENSIDVKRDGSNFVISGFEPAETGAYIIEVSGTGSYQLGVADKGVIFQGLVAHESDDSFAEALDADPLQVGAGAPSVGALIYPANDVDIFKFTADAGEEVNLSIAASTASLVDDFDATLTLFDGNQTEVSSSSNGALSFTATEGGTYFVQVSATNSGEIGFYTLSGGEPFIEKESNNTAETATEFAIGELYEAALTSGDVDWWKATLEAGTLYSFRSVDNETGGELTVEFLDDPAGSTLMDDSGWADNYDGDNFKIANIMPMETKTYYIKISGGVGAYKLLSRSNPNFEMLKTAHEPDNSFQEADALGTLVADGTDRMYVQFNPDSARFYGDIDYFRVELTAGQTFVAETKPVGGFTAASADENLWNKDTDTKLYLYDAAGNEVTDDDDAGNEWYSKITFVVPTSGVYYLGVADSRGAGGGDDRSMRRGDYILNVSASSAEVESNNTIAEANDLYDQGFIEATFADETDVDVFKVAMEAGRIYHFRTAKEAGDAITAELTAEGSSTNFLADGSSFNTRYSGSNIKINFIPETTGNYYLKLTAPAGVVDMAYNIYVKSSDINALKDVAEPNNTRETAAFVDSDGSFHDYMLYNPDVAGFHDDLDYYAVEANAGDTLIGETAPFSGNFWPRDFDAYMYLYDASGAEVATNDDGGYDWHSKIEFVVETSGTYYFLVLGEDTHAEPRNGDSNRIRDPARGEYKFALTRRNGGIINPNEELNEVYEFKLDQNYPNPFNPATNIRYQLAGNSQVTLDVFNVLGQKVATLVNARQNAGAYTVRFDASQLSSGMYLYRLQAGDQVSIQKMMLIK